MFTNINISKPNTSLFALRRLDEATVADSLEGGRHVALSSALIDGKIKTAIGVNANKVVEAIAIHVNKANSARDAIEITSKIVDLLELACFAMILRAWVLPDSVAMVTRRILETWSVKRSSKDETKQS